METKDTVSAILLAIILVLSALLLVPLMSELTRGLLW